MPASRYLKTALILGLLSAIGPFAIDMYLPALPDIGRSLEADVGSVQLTLTVFFVALCIGQLVYGPISDMVGRKPPLYFGLGLFTFASIGCALTNDVQTLIALRFVQGLGAGVGMATGSLIGVALAWVTLSAPVATGSAPSRVARIGK